MHCDEKQLEDVSSYNKVFYLLSLFLAALATFDLPEKTQSDVVKNLNECHTQEKT